MTDTTGPAADGDAVTAVEAVAAALRQSRAFQAGAAFGVPITGTHQQSESLATVAVEALTALGWRPPVALSKGQSDTAPGTVVVRTDDLRDALAWMITLVPSMGNAPSVARLRAALDQGEAI